MFELVTQAKRRRKAGRRPLARLGLVMAVLLVVLGALAGRAHAAYSAQVVNGTLRITGDGASDRLALRLQAGVPTMLEVDVGDNGSANFTFDRATFDRININAGGGNDRVRMDEANGAFTDTETMTTNGGRGDDTLLGGVGAELFLGGDHDDLVDGNGGADTGFLGWGHDDFVWDPGDGSDVVEGQNGIDTLVFNGSAGAEQFDISANGQRVRFFRNLGNITMDMDEVERVDLEALGGADAVVMNDLAGTDMELADIDLENVLGGRLGDGSPDTITANGFGGAEHIDVSSGWGAINVDGLSASMRIRRAERGSDLLTVDGRGGNDRATVFGSNRDDVIDVAPSPIAGAARVTASNIPAFVDVTGVATLAIRALDGEDTISGAPGLATLLALRLYGNADEDVLNGGDGADLMLGGSQNDLLDGNAGGDTGLLGSGHDDFVWDPGDGSDVVEGEGGTDTLVFNGSAGAEEFDFSANGQRFRFFRNLGNITMDTDEVERVDLEALGGADSIVVNNLRGTDVELANIDLEGVLGGGLGDGQPDTITMNGSNARDDFRVRRDGGIVDVTGLDPRVRIAHSEAANDRLIINGLGGNDSFAVAGGVGALIGVTVNQ
jgi:Ca2+-binding RTX toxin-like protein